MAGGGSQPHADAHMDAFDREFHAIREQLAIVNAHLAALDRRMGRFERDMSVLRNGYFLKIAREQDAIIAYELGCKRVKTLSADDLIAMVRAADTRAC